MLNFKQQEKNRKVKLLRWALFAGILFSPFLDGGIRIGEIRVVLLDPYCAVLLGVALFSKQIPLMRNGMLKWIWLWVGTWLLATIMASYFDVAISGLIRGFELLIFAIILAKSILTVKDARFFLAAFLVCVVWVSIIGWVQVFAGNEAVQFRKSVAINSQVTDAHGVPIGDRVITAFGDPIGSGHWLAIGMNAAFAWGLTAGNRRQRLLLFSIALLAALPLLASASRGPILFGFITLPIVIFINAQHIHGKEFLLIIGIVILIVGVGLLAPFSAGNSPAASPDAFLGVSFSRLLSLFDIESWTRHTYWKYVVTMAIYNPFGIGSGNFSFVAPEYMPSYLLYQNWYGNIIPSSHAESMYIQQLAENGFLGIAAYLAIAWSLFTLFRRIYRKMQRNAMGNLGLVMLGAWISACLSFVTTYGYSHNGIALTVWFFIGLGLAAPRILSSRTDMFPSRP